MEFVSKERKQEDPGFEKIEAFTDPEADREPTEKEKRVVLNYSHMAINCFCITIGVIALMLAGLLIVGDPKTLAVKSIVIGCIVSVVIVILAYVIYRIASRKYLKS